MKICAICYQPIYSLFYKPNCRCNLYYHLECINEWYKINKSCIQCRKKDTNSNQYINKKQNTILQLVVLLTSGLIAVVLLKLTI